MRWFWQDRPNWGFTLVGIWLILTGVLPLLGIAVAHSGTILSILAAAAGVLILLRRQGRAMLAGD